MSRVSTQIHIISSYELSADILSPPKKKYSYIVNRARSLTAAAIYVDQVKNPESKGITITS
jgi:hypothetical protein